MEKALQFDAHGLIPAVAQDVRTGAVLMVAWMNAEALAATLATREAHFFSRSRGKLWRKGETSGNVLAVREVRVNCDGDTLLLAVEPRGPACHTGKPTCFFTPLAAGAAGAPEHGPPDDGAPAHMIDRLAAVIAARRGASPTSEERSRSYTRSLFDAGLPRILAKIAEEHDELAAELADPAAPRDKIVHETADLLYHVLVGLAARDVPLAAVWAELDRRFGTSGLAEKAARPPKNG